ncbi:MAG: phosphoglycerate kinase [Planctomycetota bacterium]|jgi:phosphoglycerate kinase
MELKAPKLADLKVKGKRVLIRVDFNVPMNDSGQITDDTRIRAALPTLRELLARGAKPVLLLHMGRPKGQVVDAFRVEPVAKRLEEHLGSPVVYCPESIGDLAAAAIAAAPAGSCVMLENVRFHAGETKGDPELAASFAALGDAFVGDAFGASHRDHASVSGIARLLPSAAGSLMAKEVESFGRVLSKPARPLVAVLGGAKVSDKLKVINNLLGRCDRLIVGGGMAYTFLAAQGHTVGTSLLEEDQIPMCRKALAHAKETGVELLLPVDHIVATRFAADAEPITCAVDIPEGHMGLDIGPKSRELFADAVRSAKTLVWNGPMGVFEMEAFRAGTETVGRALAECQGYTIVGGGDSVAAISLLGLTDAVDHISTGGGASLELLEGKELPGITALGS